MVKNDITVVIPSIPSRSFYLAEAVASVATQRLCPRGIIVAMDTEEEGAAVTRTRALMRVETEWTAFLDDDDRMLPQHLEQLMAHALENKSDMVFPWFKVIGGGSDPFPANANRNYDMNNPHQTTITFLVKTKAAQKVGGFVDDMDGLETVDREGNRQGEDFRFVYALARAGYKIDHLHQATWEWRHHQGNTSGQAANVEPAAQSTTNPHVRPKGHIMANGEVGYASY